RRCVGSRTPSSARPTSATSCSALSPTAEATVFAAVCSILAHPTLLGLTVDPKYILLDSRQISRSRFQSTVIRRDAAHPFDQWMDTDIPNGGQEWRAPILRARLYVPIRSKGWLSRSPSRRIAVS